MIDNVLGTYETLNGGWYYNKKQGILLRIKASDRYNKKTIIKNSTPIYYASYRFKNDTTGRLNYLSGLFKTDNSKVFKIDIKDNLGIKHYGIIEFIEKGLKVELLDNVQQEVA